MFEINYGKIEVVHAADGFQGIAGSAREMANTANLRQRVGLPILPIHCRW